MNEHDDDQAGVNEQSRHLSDAAKVLDTIGLGEAKVAIEAVTDVVAIEQVGVLARGEHALFQQVGDGRLAGSRQAGEPDAGRGLEFLMGTHGLVDLEGLPVDIGGAPEGEFDHAGAHRLIGVAVDQDERAETAILVVVLKRQQAVSGNIHDADVVHAELLGGKVVAFLYVDHVLDRCNRRDGLAGVELKEVGASWNQSCSDRQRRRTSN